MKPRYQDRKKIVHGMTKPRLRRTSSWNSGERSIASQSIVESGTRSCCSVMVLSSPKTGIGAVSYPPTAAT